MTPPTSYFAGRGVLVGAGHRWLLAARLPEGLPAQVYAALAGATDPVRRVLALVDGQFGDALALVDGTMPEVVVATRGSGEVHRDGDVHTMRVGEPTGSPLPFEGGVTFGVASAEVRTRPPAVGPAGLIDGIPPEILASSAPEREDLPPPPAPGTTVVRERRPGPQPPADHLKQSTSEMVAAVRCPSGHLTDPADPTCRVCGAHVPPQEPQRVTRPTLGTLRLPTGEGVVLDRGVVLGRRPAPVPGGEQWPHLVELPGESTYLSRVHLEIRLDGWLVLGTDLGSRGGTTLRVPGRAPERMRAHEAYPLEAGWALDLADVYEVRLEAVDP